MRVFLRLKYLFLVRYSFAFFLVEHALLGRITLLGGWEIHFSIMLEFFFSV